MNAICMHLCLYVCMYVSLCVCAQHRIDVCASDKFIVHMINLISNNNKATNAPDHLVYMMCIRVAYAHGCVRARVCGLVCICMYTSIVDFTC